MLPINRNSTTQWTWADLVSSYRFWAIFLFFIACCVVEQTSSFLSLSLGQRNFPLSEIGIIISSKYWVIFIGFIVAWLACRYKKSYLLYLVGAIYLIALICCTTGLTQVKFSLVLIGILLLSIASGIVLFLIPALIADAVKDGEVFILTVGILLFIKFYILPLLAITTTHSLYNLGTPAITPIFVTFAAVILIGMLLLLPVKSCLFNEAPRIREVKALPPQHRHPVAVFLLFFVPFYFIYWCASTHREIRNFTQSPTLLTPFAAGWCSFLVPLGFPVMLSILNDNMRIISQEKNQHPCYKTPWIIFLSFFLPPLAMALVQSQLNQLSSEVDNK